MQEIGGSIQGLCDSLYGREMEFRKNSVFLLSNDEKDRDFEFFVFIAQPENHSEFLAELYHCLCGWEWSNGQLSQPKNERHFEVESHKGQLEEWLKSDGLDDKALINPLNWLKIAIERYPYRLFVVIDPHRWKVDTHNPLQDGFWLSGKTPHEKPSKWLRSPFLYKRICWIEKQEFEKALQKCTISLSKSNNNIVKIMFKEQYSLFLESFPEIQEDDFGCALSKEESFRLWLYYRYIVHLAKKTKQIKKQIKIEIKLGNGNTKKWHVPITRLWPFFDYYKTRKIKELAARFGNYKHSYPDFLWVDLIQFKLDIIISVS
ncbi:MAG: hypothetical protein C4B58_04820 [Deltaproteobacteria bacterium]|nr:MAG: hypothetical protein C4B58_04820 [Deltaproteobacteria bacterium]